MANRIIRHNKIVPNEWCLIQGRESLQVLPDGKVILPLTIWNQNQQILLARKLQPGLWLDSHEHPADFMGEIRTLPVIAINFPVFTDGRGFSLGRLLRERYAFKGELRAYGGFIRDQLFYLKRCGFDSFEFDSNQALEDAIKSLQDFSDSYQAAVDEPAPLFRRRG